MKGLDRKNYARRWFCVRTEYKALCRIPQNRVLVGHHLCCITCLVKTRGRLSSSLHPSQKEHWLSLPVNNSAGASLLREFSFFLLDDRAAGRSCRAVSSPYPGIQPHLVFWSLPSHFTLWLPGSTGPPGHCSPRVSLVVTQMLSEAISEHHAKQLVQKKYSANLVCQKAKKTNTFVWLHSCKSWLVLFWTVFGLVSSHSTVLISLGYKSLCSNKHHDKNVSVYPPRSSLYLHNYTRKHSRAWLCDQLHCTQ